MRVKVRKALGWVNLFFLVLFLVLFLDWPLWMSDIWSQAVKAEITISADLSQFYKVLFLAVLVSLFFTLFVSMVQMILDAVIHNSQILFSICLFLLFLVFLNILVPDSYVHVLGWRAWSALILFWVSSYFIDLIFLDPSFKEVRA